MLETTDSEGRHELTRRLIEGGAIAVIRMEDPRRVLRVVEAIFEGGVASIEITMTVPDALSTIEAVSRELGAHILLGVGSVLDRDTVRQAIDAGARYVVSPVLKEEVIESAHLYGAPVIPGAFSPTEIQSAHEMGADLIKVFPADVVGMAYLKALRAPMPHLKLVPTGGVTPENAGEWIKAGAVAVGIGGALLDKRAIARDDYAVLTEKARTLRRSIADARPV